MIGPKHIQRDMNRRHCLALLGSVVGLAGCLDGEIQLDPADTPATTTTPTETAGGATPETLAPSETTAPPKATDEPTTAPPTATDDPEPSAGWTDLEVAIYHRVNREREENSDFERFAPNDDLHELARTHSLAMVEWGYLGHEGPDGETHLPTFCDAASELVYGGWLDSDPPDEVAGRVVDAWMGSDGHRESIVSPTYSHVGVGVATPDDAEFELYVTLTLCDDPE